MGVMNKCFVYIILTHYGTFYTGITNNLYRRYLEHEKGKSAYLRKFKPKKYVYVEIYETRARAAKEEKKIKRVGAKKYMLKLKYRA